MNTKGKWNKSWDKSNTLVCCELCNLTKGKRFSVEEMKVIGLAIKSLNITDRRISKQTDKNFFKNKWLNNEH